MYLCQHKIMFFTIKVTVGFNDKYKIMNEKNEEKTIQSNLFL